MCVGPCHFQGELRIEPPLDADGRDAFARICATTELCGTICHWTLASDGSVLRPAAVAQVFNAQDWPEHLLEHLLRPRGRRLVGTVRLGEASDPEPHWLHATGDAILCRRTRRTVDRARIAAALAVLEDRCANHVAAVRDLSQAAGRTGSREAVAAVARGLLSPDWEARAAAVTALGNLHRDIHDHEVSTGEMLALMEPARRDPVPRVRECYGLAVLMFAIGIDPPTLELLEAALRDTCEHDPDKNVRRRAANALRVSTAARGA